MIFVILQDKIQQKGRRSMYRVEELQ